MWDNPRLLNVAADLLFGVAIFIVGCIAVLSALNSAQFPLRTLVVEGKVRNVDAQAVSDAVEGKVTGNFFAVDLESVRAALEALPGVRRAHVQRQWPDRLSVRIEEQIALARWDAQGEARDAFQLVNSHGELFRSATAEALPRFSGPLGSEAKIAARYGEFAATLEPLGATVTHLQLSPRAAWQLKLALRDRTPITLMLGRGEDDAVVSRRLERFVRYYPQMRAQLQRDVHYIDLRYPRGFAVRVPEIEKKA